MNLRVKQRSHSFTDSDVHTSICCQSGHHAESQEGDHDLLVRTRLPGADLSLMLSRSLHFDMQGFLQHPAPMLLLLLLLVLLTIATQ